MKKIFQHVHMIKLTWISGSLCTSTYFAGCLATKEGSVSVPAGMCSGVCMCVRNNVCVCGYHGVR